MIFFADVMDGADVRMIQRRGAARFTQDAPARGLVVGRRVENLDGDLALQRFIEGQEHGAHRPAAELTFDLILAELRVGLQHGTRPRLYFRGPSNSSSKGWYANLRC